MTEIQLQIIQEISRSIKLLGGHWQLQANINSWGSTLEDDDVLMLIKEWNDEKESRIKFKTK